MELYIDNNAVELDITARIAVSLSVRSIADPEKARAGYTRTIRIPMTSRNDATMGFAGEILSAERFNATTHVGRIECEGVVVMEGPLYLTRVVQNEFYEIHIIGAAKEWATAAAATPLRETPIDYSKTLSASTIEASWTNSDAVKFLPVARTAHVADHSAGGVIPAVKILTTDDYHPFINVREMLVAIFAQNGWTIESEFFDSDEFSSLYMSGNYRTRNVQLLKDAMDFLARRLGDSSAAANSQGRVYADPYRTSYTIGNLVDSASAQESSSAGSAFTDQFSRGGCFQMDDNRVAFIPTREVTAGFQYHLRYTTDVRILTRAKMAGFDEIYLGEQFSRRFTLANPYPDRRGSFRAGRTYKLAVFEHVTGRQYQLRYSVRTVSGGASTAASSAVVSGRFSDITVGVAAEALDPQLWCRNSQTGVWSLYNGDWALYDGFVEELGTLDVELTVRTAPETITPGNPKFFDSIHFGGAEPGMRLTVSEKTWVKPVFYAQPGEGSALSFAEICAHQASQMDLIAAIRQMYNLQFYTDPRARIVKIEPIRTFYIDEDPTDWTSRIDTSKSIEVAEMGGELAREMVWSYRSGDDAVSRFNRRNGGRMGRWSVKVESAAAADVVRVWENAMFTPSLSTTGAYGGAPSARLIQAGSGVLAATTGAGAGSGSGSGSAAAGNNAATGSGAAGNNAATGSGAAGSNGATGSGSDEAGVEAEVEAATRAIVEGTEDLNFLPKIVRYEGLKPLPAGENWGWPATPTSGGSDGSDGSNHASSYPKLAFHAPESGYTLCFEDRDGCEGLHANRDDASRCRVAKDSSHVILHHDWSRYKPSEAKKLPLYPDFKTGPDGLARAMVHYKDYEPMFHHYGLPSYIAGLDVSTIAYKTDKWNISRLENSFQLSGVMVLDGKLDDDEAALETVRAAEKRFAGKPGQVMFVIREGSKTDNSRFIPLSADNEGEWQKLHDQATSDIVVAHSWFRALSGLDYGGGFSSQRILHEYEVALNTVILGEQAELLEPIRRVIGLVLKTDASSLEVINRPPASSKPLYMKVWEARKAEGLEYDPEDPGQQKFLAEITKYNLESID